MIAGAIMAYVLLGVAGALLAASGVLCLRARRLLRAAQARSDGAMVLLDQAHNLRTKASQEATDREFWRIATREEDLD